ncbi:restriction endonuclease [Glutamicibacter sp.]|uniref:restriction endonuclease n=1 Tax=Glutamicibacter sp. TaxID=1931995 RepID=UPI0003B74A98
MALPQWHQFILPILQVLDTGEIKTLKQIKAGVLALVPMTEDERAELIPSGQERWYNRMNWALSHSFNAGILLRPVRASYQTTAEGKRLAKLAQPITPKMLEQYPKYQEFLGRTSQSQDTSNSSVLSNDSIGVIADETPTDVLDRAIKQLNRTLANDVYQQLLSLEPATFERLIRQFIVHLGYGVNKMDGPVAKLNSADKGIDGIIWQDALGLDRVYLQAKRYTEDNKVGGKEVRGFSGALDQHRATKGIFITTSSFTADAQQVPREVVSKTLLLIDGVRLAELMVQYGVGVQVERTLSVKKLDQDFFETI